MREIKFRAWDKEEKEMLELVTVGCTRKDTWGPLYVKDNIINGLVHSDYDIMQYTGLKDKNDVEIYEGDEIELTHSDLEGETIYSKAIAKAPMDYTLEEAVALNYAHEIELTGKNIYENPELLEVTK